MICSIRLDSPEAGEGDDEKDDGSLFKARGQIKHSQLRDRPLSLSVTVVGNPARRHG